MTCPKCGDSSFGSDDHVHTFVNLRDVKVNEKLVDAILDDSTDEREKRVTSIFGDKSAVSSIGPMVTAIDLIATLRNLPNYYTSRSLVKL